MKTRSLLRTYLLIALGSMLYAASTVLFIFPNSLLLGGTSGISVILTFFLKSSPGIILTGINAILLILALVILGKEMAVRTFVGSTVTTLSIPMFEALFSLSGPVIPNPYLSAVLGAAIIAIASGILFYVDSSSGGTDILALIVRKFTHIDIGKALLCTDLLIVIAGGILTDHTIAISSFLGLLIKTLGIDLVILLIKKWQMPS